MNIFVGNLSFQTTQDELHAAFAQYGNVDRVNIVTDRDTGQARGFAFVEMPDQREAETAISQLNGAELNGRAPLVPVRTRVTTFPLGQAEDALARLRAGEITGAAVVSLA